MIKYRFSYFGKKAKLAHFVTYYFTTIKTLEKKKKVLICATKNTRLKLTAAVGVLVKRVLGIRRETLQHRVGGLCQSASLRQPLVSAGLRKAKHVTHCSAVQSQKFHKEWGVGIGP